MMCFLNNVLICIKGSCIEQKINTAAEDVILLLLSTIKKHFCYVLNCNKQALHGKY